jgi:hypothetical protein
MARGGWTVLIGQFSHTFLVLDILLCMSTATRSNRPFDRETSQTIVSAYIFFGGECI